MLESYPAPVVGHRQMYSFAPVLPANFHHPPPAGSIHRLSAVDDQVQENLTKSYRTASHLHRWTLDYQLCALPDLGARHSRGELGDVGQVRFRGGLLAPGLPAE